MLFDDSEVEQIHQHAMQYPIMEGKVGFQKSDPDGEDSGGRTDSKIRQSDVRWCEDMLPQHLSYMVQLNMQSQKVVGDLILNIKKKTSIPYTNIDPMQK